MFPVILVWGVSVQSFEQCTFSKNFFSLRNQTRYYVLFCKEEDETIFRLHFCCPNARNLWNQLKFYLAEDLTLSPQTLQAAVFGFPKKDNTKNVIFYNHLLLIFKLYVYRSNEKWLLNVISLVNQIMKIKSIEKENSLYSEKSAISIIKNGTRQI